MTAKTFDYDALPYDEVERLYEQGWGWASIADHFGAPDSKTLEKHALRHLPALQKRTLAQAQRARRTREGSGVRRGLGRRPWFGD